MPNPGMNFETKHSIFCIVFFLTLFHLPSSIFPQGATTSPYSRYGIGELKENGFAQNFSMAGLGTALQTDTVAPYNINTNNPASFPYLRITAFETGLTSNTSQLQTGGQTQLTNASSFGYIGFAFPIKKWWGTSVGIVPFSSIGYNIKDSKDTTGIDYADYYYDGGGGINRFYWGNSFRVHKFSAGFNASYLFGSTDAQINHSKCFRTRRFQL